MNNNEKQAEDLKRYFTKKTYMNSQKAHERMLNIFRL